MAVPPGELRIQVVDDELIVSLPESSYTVNLQTLPSYSRGEYPWKTIASSPDFVRVPETRVVGSQRQGARVGLDFMNIPGASRGRGTLVAAITFVIVSPPRVFARCRAKKGGFTMQNQHPPMTLRALGLSWRCTSI